jgi:hypothetical protein
LEVAEPARLVEAPVVAEMKRAPIMAVQPTGEEVQLAQVVTPPPVEVEAAAAPAPEPAPMLPDTASKLPLIGLFGLMALGGAFAVRALARRLQ